MKDVRVGARQTESTHALWSAHDVALLSLALTAAYLALYVAYTHTLLTGLVFVGGVCIVSHGAAIAAARKGHQLTAALLTTVTTMFEIVASVAVLGWQSGIHLYLIAAGVLVFVVFTERQAAWRWIFIGVAAVAFFACQTMLEPVREGPLPDNVVTSLFSFNAVLTALLVFVVAGVSYNRTNHALAESARHAKRAEYLANTDVLTGLPNRRPVTQRLDAESAPGKGAFSVAIADLDHFKVLNDTYGHECGDRVLADFAGALRDHLRPSDAVGRWGGEEFIMVLPNTTVDRSMTLMERLRTSIEALQIECDGHTHAVTVSVGVADGTDDALWHKVVKRADDALYDAKTEGRNLVRSRPFEPVAPEAPA